MNTRRLTRICFGLALLATAGCGTDDEETETAAGGTSGDGGTGDAADFAPAPDAAIEPDAAPAEPGYARLRFGTTEGVRANPTLVDALKGRVMGDLFLGVDVGLMGPNDGAPTFGSVDLMDVDLTAVDSESEAWTSMPLAPGEYIFLGMMDLDGNAAEFDDSPDPGDLATLPLHRFTVVSGETVDALILFELVYN
jgi:hypothetical protein